MIDLEAMEIGQLKKYSIGIVTVDKDPESYEIEAVPIEKMIGLDGTLAKESTTIRIEGVDSKGKAYSFEHQISQSVPCQWLPLGGSNRATAPDVVAGEQVVIYQYGDAPIFYWTTLGIHDELRTTEDVIYTWVARPNKEDDVNMDNNVYSLRVNTREKYIEFKTTNALGEPFTYKIKLDTDYGKLLVTDDTDNRWLIDSPEKLIEFHNADGTYIKLSKEDIYAFCKNMINFHCKGDLIGKVEGNAKIEVDGTTDLISGDHFHAEAPTMDFGVSDALEPSVLGDQLATYIVDHLKPWLDNHVHLGNMNRPTSKPLVPYPPGAGAHGGDVYSKVNKNQ